MHKNEISFTYITVGPPGQQQMSSQQQMSIEQQQMHPPQQPQMQGINCNFLY